MTVDTDDPVFLKAKHVLAKMLKIRPETITPRSLLKDELGIDSVDGLDMVYVLEDKFGIEIEDSEAGRLQSVADVVHLIKERSKQGI